MKRIIKYMKNKKYKVVFPSNNNEKNKDMDYNEIQKLKDSAENFAGDKVKKLKKDKGIIERTESSKIVLTEDNKQLLVD